MQLATQPAFEIETISGIIAMADRLVRFINNPDEVKKHRGMQFEDVLGTCAILFPRAAVAFGTAPLSLRDMGPGERRDLKLRLLEDVKEHIARSRKEISAPKAFDAAPFPSDPDDCLTQLELVMGELVQRAAEINLMMANIPNARMVLHRMIDNKRHVERFSEDAFTSMPEDGRTTKKARV
jgi:hypothetical protein